MDQIREQMEISNEISDAISNPVNMGIDVDDVSSAICQLHGMKSYTLMRLGGIEERVGRARARTTERPSDGCRESAGAFTFTSGGNTCRTQRTYVDFELSAGPIIIADAAVCLKPIEAKQLEDEDDEEAQLRQLQAEMAM
jgi:hypothetical protein